MMLSMSSLQLQYASHSGVILLISYCKLIPLPSNSSVDKLINEKIE